MPFEIIRNDIVHMDVDAIVNTANPNPVIGSGTDSAIHAAAGEKLLAARRKIGPLEPGCAVITPGYNLKARYVIHTVGPVWQGGGQGEAQLLGRCYRNALTLAAEFGCQSIAFPLISTGNYGFPKPLALQIETEEFSAFLDDHEMRIVLVVFSRDAFQISETLFRDVASFIDEHYVREAMESEYSFSIRGCGAPLDLEPCRARRPERKPLPKKVFTAAPAPMAAPSSLEEILDQADAGFSETLLSLIDKSGKKDSVIYTRANVSRQHFSKIRNNPYYQPTKQTAIAFAIALELDLVQTKDLIGRAGFALTNSSKFDLIIMYFIQQKNYNLFDINAALFEFDQSLLGA